MKNERKSADVFQKLWGGGVGLQNILLSMRSSFKSSKADDFDSLVRDRRLINIKWYALAEVGGGGRRYIVKFDIILKMWHFFWDYCDIV